METWNYVISKEYYDQVLTKYSEKKPKLIELDAWILHELPETVQSRDSPFLDKKELSRLMEWKLTKGKWRPRLQKFVDELADAVVTETTKKGFQKAASGDLKGGLDELCKLKGIGPATASAILSVFDPAIPFMSDEALEVLVKSRYGFVCIFVEKSVSQEQLNLVMYL